MKVDFWQLSRDGPDTVVALIAARVLAGGGRLLVVSDDADQRRTISRTLWKVGEESFLANGEAEADHAERQPILLSAMCEPVNGANHVVFADGVYRSAAPFERAFLLFDDDAIADARATWRSLDSENDFERAFYKQEGGKWVKMS